MTALRALLFHAWFYSTLALFGVIGAPGAIFFESVAKTMSKWWGFSTVFGMRFICGAEIEFRGRHFIPQGGALIAAKHQSALDTLAPFAVLSDPAFVFKRELVKAPIFGWYLQRGGMIMVERGGHASALKAMLRAAKAEVAKGRQVVIFPEGTRQAIGAPPDYKPGVAALYREIGLPCTPVALSTGLVWPVNGFTRKSGKVVIEFLEPIPAGLSREVFMRELETRIETATARLIEEGRR
jgi:1-acyl-sn-glycerol-3-phosphate acyltransferase